MRYEKADFKNEWIYTTWQAFWLFLGSFSLLYTNILAVMTFLFHDRKKINLTNRRIIYVPLNENEVKLLGCLENLHAEYATV